MLISSPIQHILTKLSGKTDNDEKYRNEFYFLYIKVCVSLKNGVNKGKYQLCDV